MATDHSAGAQALGYLYQVWYALYLILTREEPKLAVRIEGLDDVDLLKEGKLRELLQGKQHLNKNVTLSDRSSDLWKTIRIWSEHVKETRITPSETVLTLFTTAKVSENSIAALLRPHPHPRNPQLACQRLRECTQKPTKTLGTSFNAFMNLSSAQQEQLVTAIQILERSPNITELMEKIEDRLLTVHPEYLEDVRKDFEGRWMNIIVEHLMNGSSTLIRKDTVRRELAAINERYKISLPDNWLHEKAPDAPPESELEWTEKRFVRQLSRIGVKDQVIDLAIEDYWRAFNQRTDWQVVDLLVTEQELKDYEQRLIEEWNHRRSHLEGDFEDEYDCPLDQADEKQLKKLGRQLFRRIDEEVNISIRPDFDTQYVTRGTYHMLADDLNRDENSSEPRPYVWWHPKFHEHETE